MAHTHTNTNTNTNTTLVAPHRPDPHRIRRAIARRSYCTLATVSPAGRPHVAGVVYELVDKALFINTTNTSRKARNLLHQPQVAVVIPIRRVPVGGPPSAVQFQATAAVLAADDPEIVRLRSTGKLASISSHGELELPGSCFVRIELPRRAHTYGLGMSLLSLVRAPLAAGGEVDLSR